MPFDKYNKQTKKEYEDAYKVLCNDLLTGKYDNWIIEDNLFFNTNNTFAGLAEWSKDYQIIYDNEGFPSVEKSSNFIKSYNKPYSESPSMDDEKLSHEEAKWVCSNIRNLTDTHYNQLIRELYPVWTKKRPLLKNQELEKAFNDFLYGKERLQETSELKINEQKNIKIQAKNTLEKKTGKKAGRPKNRTEHREAQLAKRIAQIKPKSLKAIQEINKYIKNNKDRLKLKDEELFEQQISNLRQEVPNVRKVFNLDDGKSQTYYKKIIKALINDKKTPSQVNQDIVCLHLICSTSEFRTLSNKFKSKK